MEEGIDTSEYRLEDLNFSDHNEEVINHFSCPICKDVMLQPYSIHNCQHTFCQPCLGSIDNDKCPLCRNDFSESSLNLSLRSLVDKLKVSCISCDWIGTFEQSKSHLKDDCTKLTLCQCDKILTKENFNNHQDVCTKVLVKCVCNSIMNRSEWENHWMNECLEKEDVECPNEKYGCWWKSKRKDLHDCIIGKIIEENKKWKKIAKVHGYNQSTPKKTKAIETFLKYYPNQMDFFLKSGLIDKTQESLRTKIFTELFHSVYEQNEDTLNPLHSNISQKKRKKDNVQPSPIELKSIYTIEGWNTEIKKNASFHLEKTKFKKPILIITTDTLRIFILNELPSSFKAIKRKNEFIIKWDYESLSSVYETPFVISKKSSNNSYTIIPFSFTIKEISFDVSDDIWSHRLHSIFIQFISHVI